LFALIWALLLPYYDKGVPMPSELFAAYGGFLLVYVGGLLALEATIVDATHTETVDSIQKVGLWLFLIIASPTVWSLTSPNGGISLTRPQQEILVGTLLTVAGFASVAYGFWRLCGRMLGVTLALFLTIYSATEIAYTIISWPPQSGLAPPMPEYLRVIFGIAKLVFTGFFCYCVSRTAMTEKEYSKGFGYWLLRFGGFR
jgi:hypothetical protein